jgi:hypothetical protein
VICFREGQVYKVAGQSLCVEKQGDWLWLQFTKEISFMLQEKRLKPWTVVRSLPNVEKVVVGEFRSWSDADGHLKILKRMVPADRLTVVFDPVVQA